MYHSLDVVYDYPFTIERESHSVQDIHFFCYTFTYFVSIGVIKDRVTKINYQVF